MDFLTHETNQDTALRAAQEILRWLRFSTGQARLETDVVGHQMQPDEISREILSLPGEAIPAHAVVRHVEFSGVSFDLIRAALAGNPSLYVPIYSEILLDAIEASFVSDIRKAILYSAIAVEVMASSRIEEMFERESTVQRGRLRVIEIEQADGQRIRKDPIFAELRKGRQFKLLLNHLPLYVGGRSMLEENQELYSKLLLLHATRNSLVHNASVAEGECIPIDHEGMRRAIDAAMDAFRWFGAAGRYVTSWRSELDGGWATRDRMANT
jgi:hypothetical protein